MPELIINELPPSVNGTYKKRNNKNGGKGMFMAEKARGFKEYVMWLAFEACKKSDWKIWVKKDFFRINIKFNFEDDKFPDPNNMLKVLLDALEGTIYVNDKWVLPIVDAEINGKNQTIVRWE